MTSFLLLHADSLFKTKQTYLMAHKTKDDNQQSVNDSWFGKVKRVLVGHIVAQMKFEPFSNSLYFNL